MGAALACDDEIVAFAANDNDALTRTDPTGRQVRNGYNGASNYLQTVTVENGANDIVTTFARNAAGDITSVTDPRGNVHTGTYDSSRRLTRYDGPSEMRDTY